MISARVLVVCITALVCGCTQSVRTSPDNVRLESLAVWHLPPRNVTVLNGYAAETEVTFRQGAHTLIVEAALQNALNRLVNEQHFLAYMKR